MKSFIPCLTCAKKFNSFQDLEQHQQDTYHYKSPVDITTKGEALYVYLNAFLHEEVMIAKKDRREARKTVQDILDDAMADVTKHTDVYSKKLITAGSTSTQTKVGKADEFDFNVELNVPLAKIRTEGFIQYDFEENFQSHTTYCHSGRTALANHLDVVPTRDLTAIPNGYCMATVQMNNMSNHMSDLTHKNFLIPRHVQEDLYAKLDLAIERRNKRKELDVRMQQCPHGPAVTMIIRGRHDHDISVDFAASIDMYESVCTHGWPRNRTRKVLSEEKINKICAASVHLVPKKDMFRYISYSRPAKVLLNIIDGWNECRRKCHKIMKRDFQIWQSQSIHGFEGISTYIFKHHLFWMNEKFDQNEGYWNDENIGECYIDMLRDLANRLEQRNLLNYFNHNENILQYKNKIFLNDLARRMRQRANELSRIKIYEFQQLEDDLE